MIAPQGPSLDVSIIETQGQMIECQTKWAAARGGTGSGKTFGWAIWLYERLCDYPKANHFVVGADYEQLRRGFFDTMRSVLDTMGLEEGIDFKYRDSPSPMILMANGARIRALSAQLAERIRSVEFQTLVLEEPPTWHNAEIIFGVLSTRLRHSKRSGDLYVRQAIERGEQPMQTRGRMSFNPPAVGSWLHEMIEERWPAEGWPCWRLSVRDNVLLPDRQEYIRGIEMSMNAALWPSQIDGHWQTAGGQVYYAYDVAIHARPHEGLPALDFVDWRLPLLWSHDFNVGFMCSVIAQYHTQAATSDGWVYPVGRPAYERYRLEVPSWQRWILRGIGEIAIEDSNVPEVVRRFISVWGDTARRGPGVILYGDPSGNQRQQAIDAASSAPTNWLTIQTMLTKAGIKWSMQVPRSAPSVQDRINEANAQFGTGEGHGVLIDVKAMPITTKDFREVKRAKNGRDIDKPPGTKLTHASDAWSYLAYEQRRLRSEYEITRKASGRTGRGFMER